MIKYIGFDKDGTLIDILKIYEKEWGNIIEDQFEINQNEANKEFRETAGEPTFIQLKKLLKKHGKNYSNDELFEKASKIASMLGKHSHKAKLFDDVIPTLERLKKDEYKIFVSSAQIEVIVRKDLERLGILNYVDFLVGARPHLPDFEKGEPHFKEAAKYFEVPYSDFVSQSVFIGDAPTDIDISKKSNITSIERVGTYSKQRLLDAGADYVVEDLFEIFDILKK